MIENTPEEIREVVEESLTKPESHEAYGYSDLQQLYNEGRKRQVYRWISEGEPCGWTGVPKRDILVEQYRLGALIDGAGTLGNKYLERNCYADGLHESKTGLLYEQGQATVPDAEGTRDRHD